MKVAFPKAESSGYEESYRELFQQMPIYSQQQML